MRGTGKVRPAVVQLRPTSNEKLVAERFVQGGRKKVKVPAGKGALGDPPEYFSEVQIECWNELVAQAPDGVLTGSDRSLLEIAAKNLAAIRAIPPGKVMTPAQSAEMRRCLGEMGMTPSERARLIKAEDGDANPFDEI